VVVGGGGVLGCFLLFRRFGHGSREIEERMDSLCFSIRGIK
jgi:hypothetical protein